MWLPLRLAWLSLASALITASLIAQPAQAQLTREPYLQAMTPHSVVVGFQTGLAEGSQSVVRYGTTVDQLTGRASATAVTSAANPSVRNHHVAITGLSPRTRYYYEVATESAGVLAGPSSQHFFVTAPASSSTVPFSFWVVADAGTNAADQHAVRDAMLSFTASDPPDLFLQVGDMAYPSGTDASFTNAMFGVYASTLVHTPLFTAVGNHEASDGTSDSPTQTGPYFEAFAPPIGAEGGGAPSGTEAYYSFDYGMAHFIVLDSDDSSVEPGSAQMSWLALDLDAIADDQQWVIAMFHHPPFTKGSHDSDVLADSGGRMTRMREQVLPVLEAGGVDLVLSGHAHSYERSYLLSRAYGRGPAPAFPTPPFAALLAAEAIAHPGDGHFDGAYPKGAGRVAHGGTVYVVAGHGGATLGGALGHPVMRYSELVHGSLLVEVSEQVLRVRNVRSDGSVADEVTLQKPSLRCATSATCNDGNPCTVDRCLNLRCRYSPTACARGQACRRHQGGCVCVPGACDDSDPCTLDACDPLLGCQSTAIDCDDQNACTLDSCESTAGCAHETIDCDDGNQCTVDSCSTFFGCANTPRDAPCDDGLACTLDDRCKQSACSGAPVVCPSPEPFCPRGVCVEPTGECVAEPCERGEDRDAGRQEAGMPDGPPVTPPKKPDAGKQPDAATAPMDSGTSAGRDAAPSSRDADTTGKLDAGARPKSGDGCGCQLYPSTQRGLRTWFPITLVLLLLARRQRRTRAQPSSTERRVMDPR